jgi:hypothetical protein
LTDGRQNIEQEETRILERRTYSRILYRRAYSTMHNAGQKE